MKKWNWDKIAVVLVVLLVVLTAIGFAVAPSHYERQWSYRKGCDVVIDDSIYTYVDTVIIENGYADIFFGNDEYITVLVEPLARDYNASKSMTVYYYFGYRIQAEYKNIKGDQYLIVDHLK